VAGAAAAGEVEAQVDVELFEQRQGDGRAAGGGAHVGQQAGEGGLVGAAGDEPQVVAVLAPVVVIDAGEGVDDGATRGRSPTGTAIAARVLAPIRLGAKTGPTRLILPPSRSRSSRASTSPAPQPRRAAMAAHGSATSGKPRWKSLSSAKSRGSASAAAGPA
jgi:hypothetical protein